MWFGRIVTDVDPTGQFIYDTMFTRGGTAMYEGPYWRDDAVTVYQGDCLDVLKLLAPNSVDAVVTDPPYGLDFMGKHWDTGAVAFDTTVWAHCLRVLKPGGHLLAFGGTRTWHRLACAIEDAGFELRDSIAWLYGSGFPKSLDVSKAIDKAAGAEREVIAPPPYSRGKATQSYSETRRVSYDYDPQPITAPSTHAARQWQGWGTALKPAFEPVVVARKPLEGTVAANVQKHGVGALNVDACRIATSDNLGGGANKGMTSDTRHEGFARPWMDDDETREAAASRSRENTARAEALGRWPTNVVLDTDTAEQLDKQSGTSVSRIGTPTPRDGGRATNFAMSLGGTTGYEDSGGASRFFPTFKYEPKAPGTERPTADGIAHPTVKPVDLMRWLVRLVTPPHGLILDPFAGTGTTGEAAIHEHKHAILIEREMSYMPLIIARLHKPIQTGFDFDQEPA
jgi:DNA modification methylase